MKNKVRNAMAALAIGLTPALMSAADITAPTPYYLMHSSGLHVTKSDDGRAVLQSAEAAAPMMLTFTPIDNGYFTIEAPDGGYLGLQGNWAAYFVADGTAKTAQYRIENAGDFFIKLRNRNNSKYLGTDDSKDGAYVYSDKDGSDSRHYWYLSTDPTQLPPADKVSYIVNPAAERQQNFEGWGVSLCWWANMCGKWSDEKIDEIVDWLVSPDGLNFRIFRYNIGGGDDPENTNCDLHHMGKGKGLRAEMEGFKDSSDGPYIWTRDEAQRKIMLKIKEKRPDAIFEAFSNSAPYYMTYSGCVSGNNPSSKDNLKPEYYEEFAHYLVDVCKHYKDVYGIEFKTLDPFNEPMTSYWGRNGGQEGCHFDVNSMIEFVKVLHPILKESGLKTVISATDETSVGQSVKDFEAFSKAGVLDLVGQWNTHTYTADNKSRAQISALCREKGMTLWMSEVGAGGSGFAGNLNMAQKLINDMRYIMPDAWIDWQYIEENNDQWCLVKALSFADGTYEKVKNYSVRSHFSRFIKEGYTVLTSLNPQTLAARNADDTELVLVALNTGAASAEHTVDLSMFESVDAVKGAYVTTLDADLADLDGCEIKDGTLTFTMPATSIVTVVVSAKAKAAASGTLETGKDYVIIPRLSANLMLEAVDGGVKVTAPGIRKSQMWRLAASGTGYTITNANGYTITENNPDYALAVKSSAADGQTFNIESLDGLYYKIFNGDKTKAFDLEGENCNDGTGVGVWDYGTSGAPVHRQWMFMQLPEGFESGICAPVVAGESSAPIAVAAVDGEVRVTASTAGTLGIYNAAGACLYSRAVTDGIVSIPLAAGYYIVAFDGASRYATPVLVK